MARGPRVPCDCCCEHVGLSPGRGPSGRRPTVSPREVVQVEVLFERVAGLDVGKASLTVCVRTPGPRRPAQRDADVLDDDPLAAGDAGLAGRARGDDRGDGVDLDLLEGAVLLPGGGAWRSGCSTPRT